MSKEQKTKEQHKEGFYGEPGLRKDTVNYRVSESETEFCGNCRFWQGYGDDQIGRCSVVEGDILQNFVTDLYEPIEKVNILTGEDDKTDHIKKFRAGTVATLEATAGKTGKEWRVQVITAGQSLNGGIYPLAVLHEGSHHFEGVPVFGSLGSDHNLAERGTRSIIGLIKDIKNNSEGIEGTFHLSDDDMQAKLLDWHKEGVLDDFAGLSIAAYIEWDYSGQNPIARQILEADSVDLVRTPAAGGKLEKVLEGVNNLVEEKENEEGKEGDGNLLTMTGDEFQSKIDAAIQSALDKNGDDEDKDDEDIDSEGKHIKAKTPKEKIVTESLSPSMIQLMKSQGNTIIRESKLPVQAADRIRASFEAIGTYDFEKLDEMIIAEKNYLASFEKVTVTNLSKEGMLTQGRVTTDSMDKILARIDAIFTKEGYIEKDGIKIPAYSSFKQAYGYWTGENVLEITGMDLWFAFNKSLRGYDSADKVHKGKIYEALQTSDWADVVVDRLHNALLLNYNRLDQYDDWRKIASIIPVNDFQPWRDTKVGGYANLPVVVENGQYPEAVNPTDEQTNATVEKHGNIQAEITMELVVNDKIGAISQIPIELARAAKRTLYQAVFDILVDNSLYGPDSTALFDATHNNQNTTALSIQGLNQAEIAMREQTKFGSTADVLGAANLPRHLIVPTALNGLGQRLVGPSAQNIVQLTADTDTVNDVLRFAGTMELIVADYFSNSTDYFLVASPTEVSGFGVLFLNGNQEPELFVQNQETVGTNFSNDAHNIKVRHIWNTVIRDFRPFFFQNVA